MLDGILLSMKGILTISKEQKHLFCRLAYKQKYPLFQYQGLKNVAWEPWCSNLSSSSLGYISLKLSKKEFL